MNTFQGLSELGLAGELLPVIPPDAVLSEGSRVNPKQRGKIPGEYSVARKTWAGMVEWRDRDFTSEDERKWDRSYPNPNKGLRAAKFPCLDIDVTTDFGETVNAAAQERLGPAPIRTRGESKRLALPYCLAKDAAPFGKLKINFTDQNSVPQAIEFLGDGQQYVIEGTHPSGAPYGWRGDDLAMTLLMKDLTPITGEQALEFMRHVVNLLIHAGATDIKLHDGLGAGGRTDLELGDESLKALDMAKLGRALAAIPNKELDYDEWMTILHAAKAGCGADDDFFLDQVLPWSMQYEENTEEGVQFKWDSISKSSIGAQYIYALARDHGWNEAPEEFVADPLAPEQDFGSNVPCPAGVGHHHMPFPHPIGDDFDPCDIPKRQWHLGSRFAPGTVTLGVAEPASGKTTIAMLSSVAILTGQELTSEYVHRSGKVWIICNEESVDELKRKLAAILRQFNIPLRDIADKIIISSGEEERLVIACKNNGSVRLTPAIEEMVSYIAKNAIIHIVIDPMVSIYDGIEENNNADLEKVMAGLRRIATQGKCSIDLLHHSNKSSAGQPGAQSSSRGASSIMGAARFAYTLTAATEAEIKNLDPDAAGQKLIKLSATKANFSSKEGATLFFRLIGVQLTNGPRGEEIDGDNVAVAVPVAPRVRLGEPANENPEECQRLRAFIIGAMDEDRVPLITLVRKVMAANRIEQSTARKLINRHVPRGAPVQVRVENSDWELSLEPISSARNAALMLIRSQVKQSGAQLSAAA